jgi:hypothetical protein
LIKLAHDVTAVIAQLPLSDLFGHTNSVARVLHCWSRCQPPHWAGPLVVMRHWSATAKKATPAKAAKAAPAKAVREVSAPILTFVSFMTSRSH